MAKQYRLKITWSNGDSEYVDSLDNVNQLSLNEPWPKTARFNGKVYFTDHIRKVEYEEIYQEASEKF